MMDEGNLFEDNWRHRRPQAATNGRAKRAGPLMDPRITLVSLVRVYSWHTRH